MAEFYILQQIEKQEKVGCDPRYGNKHGSAWAYFL